MSQLRVLRVYHSGVVDEFRQRDRILRARHSYDVHLVCPPLWNEGGKVVRAAPDADLPVHIVDVRGKQHPILFWYEAAAFSRVLRRVRPHIVDLHEEPYSLAVASALRAVQREAPKARVCIYSAQNIYKRYPPPFSQLERRALSGASAAYPCSTEAGQVLRAKGFEGRLHVLPLGVSVEPVQAVRVGRDGLRVGFLGRLEPYKGADMALRAFAEAAFDVDAKLELVGAGSQEAALKRRADRLGIRSRVEFPGALSQDEALRRISRYHIVVVPSLTTRRWKEQFGRVAAQAMAAGTPVIASDCGALPEVLGGCGEVFSQGDSSELAVKLRRLLTDVDRRRQMTECGRRRVVEHLSWERVVEGVDRMYSLALSDPQPHSDAMRLRARRAHGRDSFQSDAGGHYRRPR